MRRIIVGITALVALHAAPRAQVDETAIPGSYIAVYNGQADAAARAAERMGGTVVFNHANAGILFVESAPADFVSRMSGIAGFSAVLPDRWIVRAEPHRVLEEISVAGLSAGGVATFAASPFNAALLSRQWNIFRTETDAAWGITEGDPGVTVAIVDTGICMHHDDLAGKVDLALSRSFVPAAVEPPETAEPACIGCPDWEDRHGHGTWVASIVSTNNRGIAGVAPNVRLVAVKVGDHRDRELVTTLIRGILYAADAGVDVINVSRAHGEHPIAEFPRGMALLQRMSAYTARQGALLVFGAGNNGVDLDHAGSAIAVPCESTNGLCVGATTASDALASYSNHGVSAVTMVAPGGGLPVDPLPDTPFNTGVLAACSVHSVSKPCAAHTYDLVLGTSFAAPMVAGAAALVISNNPHFKGRPHQVKAALVQSADDLGAAGTDNLFSRGRLNTLRALR